MKQFAQLFTQLDQTTKTLVKVKALKEYFEAASDQDRLWTIAILSGKRPKRTVNTRLLREWAAELADVPLWLFEDSYHVVGDLGETIALILPEGNASDAQPLSFWIEKIQDMKTLEEEDKKSEITEAWAGMDYRERFVFNKLIGGSFRMGVSQKLMVRALAQFTGQEEPVVTHRIMGNWTPDSTTFQELLFGENILDDISKPYPFYLAYAIDFDPNDLGTVEDWQFERKWDGIRGQLIVRNDQLFVWSRGEELVTDKFPEYAPLAKLLPNGTVIDGEILPWKDGKPLTFNHLQTRIGRKNVTKKVLESAPVTLMAYDLLEWDNQDFREEPLSKRREKLAEIVANTPSNGILRLSEIVTPQSWEDANHIREDSRRFHSEGLMVKKKDSTYRSGRKRGDWWKWKVDPLVIDAVLIYAMRGHGRRANLYTDYTFAVWDGEKLVPFTKSYSGLTDAEIRRVDAYVKKNTIDRFGPVRSVTPKLVMEIAFEGIQKSTRHKSGVALRFPRINRWREDKPVQEANTLEDLKAMLEAYG